MSLKPDPDTNTTTGSDCYEQFSLSEDQEDTADDVDDDNDDDDDDDHEEEFISPASPSLPLEPTQVEMQQQPTSPPSPSPLSSDGDGDGDGIGNLPAQLHPACSQGIRRVSSCYGNHESMVDLLSQLGDKNKPASSSSNSNSYDTFKNKNKNEIVDNHRKYDVDDDDDENNNNDNANTHYWPIIDNYNNSVDNIFSHDIMMQVFTYLDTNSLMSFSETARRCNYETFYFLQLQLQQALLVENNNNDDNIKKMKNDNDNNNNNNNSTRQNNNNNNTNTNTNTPPLGMESQTGNNQHSLLTTIEDSASILSRVAKQDMVKAKEIVQQYQDSNSTLRQMPLSYSLAYVRHYLLHNGFHNMFSNNNNNNNNSSDVNNNSNSTMTSPSSQTLASAAIFMTVVGAASLAASSDAAVIADELPNVLFRVGFVGGLVNAARKLSDTERGMAVREKAEQMARSMKELPAALMTTTATTTREEDEQHHQEPQQQSSQRTQPLHQQSDEVHKETQSQSHPQQRTKLPSLFEMRRMLHEMMSNLAAKQERQPILFDPYDHLPSSKDKDNTNDTGISSKEGDEGEKKNCDGGGQEASTPQQTTTATNMNTPVDRKMPSGCVGAYSRAIYEAANHTTKQIKESRISKFQALSTEDQRERSVEFLAACTSNDSLDRVKEMISIMDVNRFFVGNDGTETCALHTSSFNGADKVVDFLCMDIHHQNSQLDGGLCDVNSRDTNGWTALHFAAGANSVPVVRVLARHGATFNVEAQNGYSPLEWAIRLSNEQVAEELRVLMIRVGTDHSMWISSQPLASIANRFFSLIPTQ